MAPQGWETRKVTLTAEQWSALEGSLPNEQESASGAAWLDVCGQLVGLPGQPRKVAAIEPLP